MKRKQLQPGLLWRFLLVTSFIIGACNLFTPTSSEPAPTPTTALTEPTTPGGEATVPGPAAPGEEPTIVPPATAPPVQSLSLTDSPRFAIFKEPSVAVIPAVSHEPIAPDLSNVRVSFILSQDQLERLARDGFVVSPGAEKEFFTVYEKARYDNVPIFVTSDSLLHVYHLLFGKVLRTAESEYFIPLLRSLNQSLLAETDAQYQSLAGHPWQEAAKRSVAFVGVASKLLDPSVQVPAYTADLVNAELALINAAAGLEDSPLFPGLKYGEDYTQYIPRGHYTKSEELEAYFKSMMWYGRMTFRLKGDDPEIGRAETRAALLLVQALRNVQVNGRPAMEAWEDLYSPTVFFVGRSDDLTVVQYIDVIDAIYGPNPSLPALTDDAYLDPFIETANQLPQPMILGIVVDVTEDVEDATKGMRFMGQRFVPDAYIFRELIFRNISTLEHRRGLPKGMDLMAAMGSDRAYQLLDEMEETTYEGYPEKMAEMQTWLAGLTVPEWTETLNNAWLYSFYPLLEVPGEGYPAFMRSQAWLDKQLNTALGSWAELKHDTILYAKQAYAELGGGPPPPPPLPPNGYVEPVPQFYARLSALTAMTRTGLEERGLLSELDRHSLETLEDLSRAFQVMAEKELRGEPLTEDEYERIRYYGGEIEHLTMAAADSDTQDPYAPLFIDEEPQAAVIADVATDPAHGGDGVSGLAVLEEGVGRINQIHVVVPIVAPDGSTYLQVAKGGVFSYYEFVWPGADRLTDEKWRQMLDEGQAPPPPEWTHSFFTPESEFADLGRGVLNFQKDVTYAYWDPEYGFQPGNPALAQFQAEIQELWSANQYMSHQLVFTQFRSFDIQSDSLAVVTVRETWQDGLMTFEGGYPNYDEAPFAQRGPYTLDVTYTMEYQQTEYGGYWQVTQAIYNNQPPAWE